MSAYLDKGHDQTRIHMPFNVAMEQPHARVIRSEAHDNVAIGPHQQDISSHRLLGQDHRSIGHGLGIKVARFLFTTKNRLEGMAVEMEGMFARILVVEDYFDNVIVLENVRVGVDTVYAGVCGEFTRCQGCV